MTGTEVGLIGALVSVASISAGVIFGKKGVVSKTECERQHAALSLLLDEKFQNMENKIRLAILEALGREES